MINYKSMQITAALLLFFSFTVFSSELLTLEKVRETALENNSLNLKAEQDIEIANSEIVSARAGAFPEIELHGYYNRNIKLPTFFLNPEGGDPVSFKSGFNNDFGMTLSVRQSIWKGGRVFHAYKLAKLYKNYSEAIKNQVEQEVTYTAQVLFFAALLSQTQYEVLEKAFESLAYNYDIINKQFEQGMVSQYDLLRAKVEKSNIEPQMLKAKSDEIIAYKRLKSFLGYKLDKQIELVPPKDDTSLADLPTLSALIERALNNRAESKQAKIFENITERAVSVMKADHYPDIEAFTNYNWSAQSDRITLSDNNVESWTAGLSITIPIFSGGRTSATVRNYQAENNKARIQTAETRDIIVLEVQSAYDNLMQAKKSLDIQGNTIAEAEEGLRIARLRYESGLATLLDLLSSETALMNARNSLATALYRFRSARASLTKATTYEF